MNEDPIKNLTHAMKIVRAYIEQTTDISMNSFIAQPTRLEWLAIKEVLEACENEF